MGGGGDWPGDQWAANVTNVVKPTQFTSPHKDPCYKRRQSKPKNRHYQRKSPQIDDVCNNRSEMRAKTPRIDDVCNNMHQSTPKNSTRETPVTPTGSRGTGPRCRRAVAGPGQTTSQRTEQHQRPGTTGVEGTGESGGPGCSARGRRRGLAGLRADAQAHVSTPSPTGVEGTGGTGGPGCDTRGQRRGLVAVPVGGGRARAGLEIDHSEPSGSRVAISRAGRRPPALQANWPTGQAGITKPPGPNGAGRQWR